MVTLNKMDNERMKCRLMEKEAEEYIKLHKIMELLRNMTASLLYHQPGSLTWHVNSVGAYVIPWAMDVNFWHYA